MTELQFENSSALAHINYLNDLTDPERSYNLTDAMRMKKALEEIDKIIKAFESVKTKIASQYSRTIGEYQEADILESDGVIIKLLKQGRGSLDVELARKLFPDACEYAQVTIETFNTAKFAEDHPDMYPKYIEKLYNLTLTALKNSHRLTDEELVSVTKRAPNTYGVDLVSGSKE
jgi:hypothetical protein